MTVPRQKELDLLLEGLELREPNQSHLSIFAIRDLHKNGDIQQLRFHYRFWDGSSTSHAGNSLSVCSVIYKAAQILGEDPIMFVTDEHFLLVRRLWQVAARRTIQYTRTIELAPFMALLLENPERGDFMASLIRDRGIVTVEGLLNVMESAEGIHTAMSQGAL